VVARAGDVTVALASAGPAFDLALGRDAAATGQGYTLQDDELIVAWNLGERTMS
jgi:hypothetical protein